MLQYVMKIQSTVITLHNLGKKISDKMKSLLWYWNLYGRKSTHDIFFILHLFLNDKEILNWNLNCEKHWKLTWRLSTYRLAWQLRTLISTSSSAHMGKACGVQPLFLVLFKLHADLLFLSPLYHQPVTSNVSICSVCVWVCVCMCMCVCVTCMCNCVCTYAHVCVHARTRACMHSWVCVCDKHTRTSTGLCKHPALLWDGVLKITIISISTFIWHDVFHRISFKIKDRNCSLTRRSLTWAHKTSILTIPREWSALVTTVCLPSSPSYFWKNEGQPEPESNLLLDLKEEFNGL